MNRVPLPSIPRDCYGGVILPPVEEQLTARTFDVVNGARVVQRMLRGGDYPMILGEVGGLAKKGSIGGGGGGGSGGSGSSNKKRVGGYGSTIGRQIAVNLKNISKREGGGGDDDDNGGDEKSKGDGGATATPAPASSKASSSSGGGSKSQKRKLTEL